MKGYTVVSSHTVRHGFTEAFGVTRWGGAQFFYHILSRAQESNLLITVGYRQVFE